MKSLLSLLAIGFFHILTVCVCVYVQHVLLIVTKLQHVIATLALESAANTGGFFAERRLKPRDEIFWFKKPEILLNLIHFILFQVCVVSFHLIIHFHQVFVFRANNTTS
uniref:Uncharacterized protein n=1 Tax=Lactuca sativa TaxID=4236 RepID=A0A9R1VA39_LACSA|nr:hypothetical protein LSAT_V11C600310360 [Lactuca sativa]